MSSHEAVWCIQESWSLSQSLRIGSKTCGLALAKMFAIMLATCLYDCTIIIGTFLHAELGQE